MKRLKFIIAIVFLYNSTLAAQTIWTIDPSHSKVNFSASHLVISEVDGVFNTFNGTITAQNDSFKDAKFSFEINASSIDTGNENRDKHLKSEDFFHIDKHPKITFQSTSFKKKRKNNYVLKGKLTMRGITKDVTLNVKYGGIINNDGYGNVKSGFIISGTINRIDYGVAWNAKTEHGGLTVGENIDIVIKIEAVKG